MMRKEHTEIFKKTMVLKPEGKERKKGSSNLRWIDEINYGTKACSMRNWRMFALDREMRKEFLEEAKAQQ